MTARLLFTRGLREIFPVACALRNQMGLHVISVVSRRICLLGDDHSQVVIQLLRLVAKFLLVPKRVLRRNLRDEL